MTRFVWAIFMPMMVVAAGGLVRKTFAFASGKPMDYEARPVGSILEQINDVVVLNRTPIPFCLFYSRIWAVGSFVLAWFIFDKAEPTFPESI
jgi:hypothetical protein